MGVNINKSKTTNYNTKEGVVGRQPYHMKYKHYIPAKLSGEAVIALIGGGGHLMKIWEITPDGRKGWAPLFAEKGREVITVEWACNSGDVYRCSAQELCRLTQEENMKLIKKVIEKVTDKNRKVVFLGWSMGGPQVFKLATDIMPKRTVAISGYGATGPLNCFEPQSDQIRKPIDLNKPLEISREAVLRISDSPFFPKKYLKKYMREYLVLFSSLMAAIQSKHPIVKKYWKLLTIKNPKKMPPILLVNGARDQGHQPAKEKILINWLKKYQKDVSVKYVKGFSHVGMILRGNEKVARIYLNWLKDRNL
ncbi:MAG: hypothetical protein AAB911_01280 [Patescibacteria group bacterium]